MNIYMPMCHFSKCFLLSCLFSLVAQVSVVAQTSLWISGSAVPGGTQPLTRFSTGTAGKYAFKYHGTLLPGTLCVQNTEQRRPSTRYYAPKQVDSNIVNNGIATVLTRDSIQAAWTVLFEADNYRFTITPSENMLTGELFAQWYEAWIVGGCVEDNQGSGESAGQWQVSAGKAMTHSLSDPNEWSWTGELKVYKSNVESNRLKINGQYGWGPKALHPFVSDQELTQSTQFWYNGPNDTKWTISKDGYYTIVINVFKETMKAVYWGTTLPSGVKPTHETNAEVSVSENTVLVSCDHMVTCRLYSVDGRHLSTQSGTQVALDVSHRGVYLLHVSDGESSLLRKISIK